MILQFLHEHRLTSSFSTLMQETNVRLPGLDVDTVRRTTEAVRQGSWDTVLVLLQPYKLLPEHGLSSLLYEMVVDLGLQGESATTQMLVRRSPLFTEMVASDMSRYMEISSLATCPLAELQKRFPLEERQQRLDRLATKLEKRLPRMLPAQLLTRLGNPNIKPTTL